MIVVFIGAPGSGKGTQSQALCRQEGWDYIATGNLLRSQMASNAGLGKKLKSLIDTGEFLSDSLIMDVFKNQLLEHKGKHLLLDGIPRTLNQARLLDEIFSEISQQISCVVEFKLDDRILLERILGRYSCKGCGATYHKTFNPTHVLGKCDFCEGEEFVTRADDQEEVLKKRLELYYLETSPILEYYRSKGTLHSIDASLPPEKVGSEILSIIKSKAERGE